MDFRDIHKERWLLDEVIPHQADLRLWLQSRFRGINDIDDVVQEVLIRILKAHESGPIVNPRAYMFVVARNLALNQIRHHRAQRLHDSAELDVMSIVDEDNSPPEDLALNEEVNLLIQAIQSLPKRCRQVMTLRKIYGLSKKEVARQLGMSVNTVEVQSQIGLQKCVKYFRQNGDMAH